MIVKNITVTEIVRHFSDYINRVVYRHEAFVLRKGRKPVAELRPMPFGRRLGDLPEILRSLPHLPESDRKVFAADVEKARRGLTAQPLKDSWES